jgi:hypothetical protein
MRLRHERVNDASRSSRGTVSDVSRLPDTLFAAGNTGDRHLVHTRSGAGRYGRVCTDSSADFVPRFAAFDAKATLAAAHVAYRYADDVRTLTIA